MIPKKLKKWTDTLADNVEEMKDDFMIAVKKAIVDFVLKDPSFVESVIDEFDSPHRRELTEMCLTWQGNFATAKGKLQRIIHITNPCLHTLVDLWYTQFRKLRLVNIEELKKKKTAYDLIDFGWIITKHIEDAKATLIDHHYKAVIDVFLAGYKKNKLPSPSQPKRMKRFYDCVASLMTYHLQTLALKSLFDYTNYILDVKVFQHFF